MNYTAFVGIDPGKTGGLAVFCGIQIELYKREQLSDQAAADKLAAICAKAAPCAILETASANTANAGTIAKQFEEIGFWRGLLTANKIPFQMMKADQWHKIMLVGKPTPPKRGNYKGLSGDALKDAKKAQGRIVNAHKRKIKLFGAQVAERMFPHLVPQWTGPQGGIHDGLVDATLLMETARRTFGGGHG